MPPSRSQLVEGALVSVDIAADAQPLVCRVVAFGGDDVVLSPTAVPDGDQHAALERGGEAFLLLDGGNELRALRCRVTERTEQGDVVAEIVDPFRLGQRRTFSRAALVLPALVTPLGEGGKPAGETWQTFTRDVSAGGLRIARQSGYAAARLHAVVLDVPGGEDPIEAVVEVRRESEEDLGVRFAAISAGDRLRLERATITWLRPPAIV